MSFESLTRNVHAILSFYNEKSELVDISRAVSSISLKEITCSDDTLKMGEFCKNCLEFEYYQEFVDENIAWNNKRVKLSFTEGNTEEEKTKNTVDVGIFYVQAKDVETSNNGKSYKVTCYDLPSVMSETFDTTKTSSSVTDIVKYIGSISGMYFKDGTTFGLDKIESVDEELTNIGMLAYIVGYDGKNIRTTADGKLETYWYYSNTDSSHFKGTISRDVQLLNEFTNKEVVSPLNAITSGYTISDDDSSTVISVGSGVAMTYTNPYITKEQLQSVLDRVKGFDYSVGSVKFRGNPTYRCGDTVQVETTQGEYVLFPIMEQTITYDGGMVATISSYTYETENTVMGSGGSVDKKISKVYSGLTASFQKQTGLINTNLKGGYYRLLQDADTKYPYGWLIADSEEITDSTKGWRWTQGGLAYSEDGFKTASKIAITMDGQISADMITVGSMDGGLIKANTIQVEQLSEDVQSDITTAKEQAQEANSSINGIKSDVTSINNSINTLEQTTDQLQSDVSNAQSSADSASDLAKQAQEEALESTQKAEEANALAQSTYNGLNDLEQVVQIDSTGVKVLESANSKNYSQIKSDGMHVFNNGEDVAQFGQQSKMNNLAVKDFLMFGAHRAELLTVDGVQGTAFYWIGDVE